MDAEQVGKAIQGLGCLIILVLIALFGGWMALESLTKSMPSDDVQRYWDAQTPVFRTAMCAPVIRDPDFNGTAEGLARGVNKPGVTVYTAKAFLLDECFPS